MSEHLTKQQIDQYAQQSLPPADLLDVDEHLATCAECRDKAVAASGYEGSVSTLRKSLAPTPADDLDHPDHDLLAGYVDGILGDVDKEIVDGHLEFCARCAAEVADLRSFQRVLTSGPDKEYSPAPGAGMFQRMDTVRTRRPAYRFAPAFALAASVLIAAVVTLELRHPAKHQAGTQVAKLTPVEPNAGLTPPEVPAPAPTRASSTPSTPAKPEASAKSTINPAMLPKSIVPSTPAIAPMHVPVLPPARVAAVPIHPSTPGHARTLPLFDGNNIASPAPMPMPMAAPPTAGQPSTNDTVTVIRGGTKSQVNVENEAATSKPAAPPAPSENGPLHPDDNLAMSAPAAQNSYRATGGIGGYAAKTAAKLPASVQQVIASGHLDLDTAVIRSLTEGASIMNNIGSTSTFTATSPVSTAVLTDRPSFSWTESKDAGAYQVVIVDGSGADVAQSPTVSSTSWRADKPLPRGVLLKWQVKAVQNGSAVETAPEGGARFRIVDADRAAQIIDAQKTFSDQPMALGILYAQAGMLDDAERALQKARKEDPRNELVPKLLADVKTVREGGL